jgi:hypothetical protein
MAVPDRPCLGGPGATLILSASNPGFNYAGVYYLQITRKYRSKRIPTSLLLIILLATKARRNNKSHSPNTHNFRREFYEKRVVIPRIRKGNRTNASRYVAKVVVKKKERKSRIHNTERGSESKTENKKEKIQPTDKSKKQIPR